MSIYCTILDIGSEHTPRCKRMKRIDKDLYQQDDSKPCTCKAMPVKYEASHILPTKASIRDGNVHVSAIPPHITRGGKDGGGTDRWRPWLRLGVNDATVLLTPAQVGQLRKTLSDWLSEVENGFAKLPSPPASGSGE